MLPQYVITLGARTATRTAEGAAGIFTERDYATIERIVRVKRRFNGCTIIRCKGFFGGKQEDSVQIIILERDYSKVAACAQQLRATFRQKSVLLSLVGVGEFLTSQK